MNNKTVLKKAIIWTCVCVISIGLIIGIIFASFSIASASYAKKFELVQVDNLPNGDKIHFLNTENSDCILIESEGKFGLVDCGEDNDNPRNFPGLKLEGYEQRVVDYVKKVASKDGKVKLDFILGTHAHSDHIGGFDTLLKDKDISVKTAYVKRYYEDRIIDSEVNEWDNKEVYDALISAANENGATIVQDLTDLKFKLGNFNMTIFNGQEATPGVKVGENENSIALLVDNGKHRTLLNGDMNNIDGDEDRVAQQVGKVEIMKPGHHGYKHSSTSNFVKKTNPDIAIITNKNFGEYGTYINFTVLAKSAIFVTGKENGIILDVSGEKIVGYKNIH